MASTDQIIDEQIAYYRARAAEYERTAYGDVAALLPQVVEAVPPGSDVLELACGTGVWTEQLVARAATVTAVDAAPEMIELARVRAPQATFVVADLFAWQPPRRYDAVFFSAWLSHVPAERFGAFWALVGRCLRDGGAAVFLDEHVSETGKERWVAPEVVERSLSDGSTHRIVKTFFDPTELVERLHRLGWNAEVRPFAPGWVLGTATPIG
jgi:demethylmenaquinone methyltransferase/2-methoxy-6-polyprenyl-1,4-benzoquinol methylase